MSRANSAHTHKKPGNSDQFLFRFLSASWAIGLLGIVLLSAFTQSGTSIQEWKIIKDIRFNRISSTASRMLLQANYNEAYQLFQQVLPLASSPEKRLKTLGHLGMLHAARNEHEEAVSTYKQALQIEPDESLEEQRKLHEAELLQGLGSAFMGNQEWDSASVYFERAVNSLEAIQKQESPSVTLKLAQSLNGKAQALIHQNHTQEAQKLLFYALSLLDTLELPGNPTMLDYNSALVHTSLGQGYAREAQFGQSEEALLKAYELLRSISEANPGKIQPELARVLYHRGTLYLDHQLLEAAEAALLESTQIYEQVWAEQPEAYNIAYSQLLLARTKLAAWKFSWADGYSHLEKALEVLGTSNAVPTSAMRMEALLIRIQLHLMEYGERGITDLVALDAALQDAEHALTILDGTPLNAGFFQNLGALKATRKELGI